MLSSLANSWLAWYHGTTLVEVNLVTRFLSTSFPTAAETAYRRPNLHILYAPPMFNLFMLPGNIHSRPVSLRCNGITLSLYDEAQVALRSKRIEKNRLHSLRDIQECINRKQYWHFWQFTHYLPHIHNPTKLGTMYRNETLDQSMWAAFSWALEHCKTMAIGIVSHWHVNINPCIMALCFYSEYSSSVLNANEIWHSWWWHRSACSFIF